MNILTTIPKSKYKSWIECRDDLLSCTGEDDMFWLVNMSTTPKKAGIGDLCYMIYDGIVRGYMDIVHIAPTESFREMYDIGKPRTTTSLVLANWHPLPHLAQVEHTGFQGYRYTQLHP